MRAIQFEMMMIQPKGKGSQRSKGKRGRKVVAAGGDVVEARRAGLGDIAEAGRVCDKERRDVRPSGVTSFAGCRCQHVVCRGTCGSTALGSGTG